jgi:hypothetical protein
MSDSPVNLRTQGNNGTLGVMGHDCPMCSQMLAATAGDPANLDLENLPPWISGLIPQLLRLAQQMPQNDGQPTDQQQAIIDNIQV